MAAVTLQLYITFLLIFFQNFKLVPPDLRYLSDMMVSSAAEKHDGCSFFPLTMYS